MFCYQLANLMNAFGSVDVGDKDCVDLLFDGEFDVRNIIIRKFWKCRNYLGIGLVINWYRHFKML